MILRQRIEQLMIKQIQLRHLQILAVARQLVSVEQVLRQNIRFVIRSLLFGLGQTPGRTYDPEYGIAPRITSTSTLCAV